MYYVLERGIQPGRWIGHSPFIKGVKWRAGVKITHALPDRLEFTLKPFDPDSSDHAPYMPAYLKASPPLFRDDLLEAMRECGVENLDLYDVVIRDPDNDHVHTNYKAVNIIGLIAAADMLRSDAIVHPGSPPLIDVDFDRLVLDETTTHGALIFRLAESTNAILVHPKLRDFLLGRGFTDLAFYTPDEVAL
ncbi:MAG: hypothetical protein H8K06_03630 [Nitrospira sp.]|uniref:Suppressor of fused-like domain-containing protein n=1 Tax=Nitrospira defluvii TaxID=330214 RepID=A0ABM8S088_9BACT|nr:hypothetical protein [Nitrospira defluvii]MCS6326168.1 hypothetical protein [Nitrospira sp.]CAE6781618.1 conserved hypothetical protein [Nitrospira defluvii]